MAQNRQPTHVGYLGEGGWYGWAWEWQRDRNRAGDVGKSTRENILSTPSYPMQRVGTHMDTETHLLLMLHSGR